MTKFSVLLGYEAAALHHPLPTFPLLCLEVLRKECPVTWLLISKGSKPQLHRCENLQIFKFRATLKRVISHPGSSGNESHLYSGAARSDSWPGHGLS